MGTRPSSGPSIPLFHFLKMCPLPGMHHSAHFSIITALKCVPCVTLLGFYQVVLLSPLCSSYIRGYLSTSVPLHLKDCLHQ